MNKLALAVAILIAAVTTSYGDEDFSIVPKQNFKHVQAVAQSLITRIKEIHTEYERYKVSHLVILQWDDQIAPLVKTLLNDLQTADYKVYFVNKTDEKVFEDYRVKPGGPPVAVLATDESETTAAVEIKRESGKGILPLVTSVHSTIYGPRNKIKMLEFSSEGCSACVAMESTIISLRKKGWHIDKIMYESGSPLIVEYKVDRFPIFVVLKGPGTEIARFIGATAEQTLEAALLSASKW